MLKCLKTVEALGQRIPVILTSGIEFLSRMYFIS